MQAAAKNEFLVEFLALMEAGATVNEAIQQVATSNEVCIAVVTVALHCCAGHLLQD